MIAVVNGNALALPFASGTVQTVVTSPPYYGLRDYGTADQIGLEETPEAYVANLVAVFREVRRVLKDDGTLWLNLGDSYAGSWGNYGGQNRGHGKQREIINGSKVTQKAYADKDDWRPPTSNNLGNGLKPKDLIGIPWMVAFSLRADGWYLRSDIIWHKPNPMPESVTDRPTKAHEYMFLLSKSQKYYYDHEAIKEPAAYGDWEDRLNRESIKSFPDEKKNGIRTSYSFARKVNEEPPPGQHTQHRADREPIEYSGKRNRRTVWTIATRPYKGAHFATFPEDLVEPCILAGSKPGDLVLDPFSGTATVGRVCARLQRDFIGTELNREYIILAQGRTSNVQIEMIA